MEINYHHDFPVGKKSKNHHASKSPAFTIPFFPHFWSRDGFYFFFPQGSHDDNLFPSILSSHKGRSYRDIGYIPSQDPNPLSFRVCYCILVSQKFPMTSEQNKTVFTP